MTILQAIVTIVASLIAGAGASFGFLQFMIKRKDDKEEKNIQNRIDSAVEQAKKEMMEELNKGLLQRGEEGRERFEINSKQIEQNSTQINEILSIVKDQAQKYNGMADSLVALNKVTKASAEGVRNTIYDKILIIAGKALKRQKITMSEKTNLKQLYNSYTELQGNEPKITTYYDECMKLLSVPDEEEII